MTFVEGDVCSHCLVRHVLKSENIDTILHFAAQTHVDNSFGNSLEFTKDNVEGTHALLEASKSHGSIRRFLHVSTDEVYGETSYQNASNTEQFSVLAPTNPYSASKAAAEMLVMAYGRSYNLPYVITRGNNVYGPHQYPEKAIPKFSLLALDGRQLPIHGDGTMKRSYMYVSDAANAFDIVLHKGVSYNIYNIGTTQERSIRSVAEDICTLAGRDTARSHQFVADRAFNDRRYYINCSKLIDLGWTQQVSWKEGLAKTFEWYRMHGPEYWGDISEALVPHPRVNRP